MKQIFSLFMALLIGIGAMYGQDDSGGSAVYNETTGTGYSTFEEAWKAAGNEAVLVVNEDVTVSERLAGDGRSFTVKGKNKDTKIVRAKDKSILFLINNGNDNITFENITFDGNDVTSTTSMIEVSAGTVSLNDVEIVNEHTSANAGHIQDKTNGHLIINGLSVNDCSVAADHGSVFVGNNNVKISGECDFSVYVEKTNHITDQGVSGESNIPVIFEAANRGTSLDVISGAKSLIPYICEVSGYKFAGYDGTIKILEANAAEEESAVYNETQRMHYSSLSNAWDGALTGAVLVLNEDASIKSRLNSTGRAITVRSKEGTARKTIFRESGYNAILFLSNNAEGSNGEITLENLIIDGNDVEATAVSVECSHHGIVNLRNMTFQNCKTSSNDGHIAAKNSQGNGTLNIEGLTVTDCTVPEGHGHVSINANSPTTLSGQCVFTLYLNEGNSASDEGVTAASDIMLLFDANHGEGSNADSALITGATNTGAYSCGVDDHKLTFDIAGNIYGRSSSYVEIPEDTKPVYNQNSKMGFESLVSAWNAAATGDVLVLNESASITERLNANGRSITVRSKEGTKQTVGRAEGYTGILFLTSAGNDANGEITLENVTVDGADIELTGTSFEASGNGTLNLNGVNIANVVTTNEQGVISVKNGGHLNINGLSISGSTVPEGMVFVGTDGVTIGGTCSFSMFIEGAHQVADKGVAAGSTVTLLFDEGRSEGDNADSALVTGAANTDAYICGVADYKLTTDESGNIYAVSTKAPVIPEESKAVYNQTSGKGFSSLTAAWGAAATGDVLVLNESASITERLNANGRSITVRSKEGTKQTVGRAEGYTGILFLTSAGNDANGEITLENVTVDGADIELTGTTFEASGNGTLNLNGVNIVNVKTTNEQGVISVKNGGHLNINGLSISGSTVPEGMVFVGTDGVTIGGTCSFSMFIEAAHQVADNGVTAGSTVTLLFDEGRTDSTYADKALVTGATSVASYICGVADYKLTTDESGNICAVSTKVSVVPEESKAVYNQTSGKGFNSIASAWSVAASGDVLVLNEAASITERLNADGRMITVRSKDGSKQTISRAVGYKGILFLTSAKDDANGEITLENVNIDGADVELTGTTFEASGNGTLNLNGVSIANVITTNDQGVISVKNGGKLNIEDLTIENSSVPSERGEIFAGTNGIKFSGECNFTLLLEQAYHATDNGLTGGNIGILIDTDNRDYESPVIVGAESTDGYTCLLGNHTITAADGMIYINENITSSVDGIEGDTPVNVYTLQGHAVKVNVPASQALEGLTPGIYLVNGRKTLIRQ